MVRDDEGLDVNPKQTLCGFVTRRHKENGPALPLCVDLDQGALWNDRKEQKNGKNGQVYDPLKDRGAASAKSNYADKERERQENLILLAEPKFDGLVERN